MGFNRVRVVDPYDLAACDQAVKEELAAAEPSVIISRRPCALLKYVKHQAPLAVDTDKCVGCKLCTKVCPRDAILPIATAEEKEKYKAIKKAQAEKAAAAKAAETAALPSNVE